MFIVARYQQHMQKHLKDLGLGLSEYPALIYLLHHDDPETQVSQTDLAKRMHRDPALVTRAARRLVEKGLISIEPAADNRSRHILRLTERGYEVARSVDDVVWAWEEQVYEDFSEEERLRLNQLLAKLDLPE